MDPNTAVVSWGRGVKTTWNKLLWPHWNRWKRPKTKEPKLVGVLPWRRCEGGMIVLWLNLQILWCTSCSFRSQKLSLKSICTQQYVTTLILGRSVNFWVGVINLRSFDLSLTLGRLPSLLSCSVSKMAKHALCQKKTSSHSLVITKHIRKNYTHMMVTKRRACPYQTCTIFEQ
jgi:hypothetical protein